MSKIKLKLKKIDPVKAGIIYGLLMVLISLVIIVPMFLIMSAFGLGTNGTSGLAIFGGGIAMVIIVPVFYGIIGFIFGLIGTALMNFILSKTDGLDIEFDSDKVDMLQIGKEESKF